MFLCGNRWKRKLFFDAFPVFFFSNRKSEERKSFQIIEEEMGW